MSATRRDGSPRYSKYFKIPVTDSMHEEFTALADDCLTATATYLRGVMRQHLHKVKLAEAEAARGEITR